MSATLLRSLAEIVGPSRARGGRVEVLHVVEVLDRAYQAAEGAGR